MLELAARPPARMTRREIKARTLGRAANQGSGVRTRAGEPVSRSGGRWVGATISPEALTSLRLCDDAQIGLGRLPALREALFRLFVGNRAGDDDVVAVLPVRRRCDLM